MYATTIWFFFLFVIIVLCALALWAACSIAHGHKVEASKRTSARAHRRINQYVTPNATRHGEIWAFNVNIKF